VEIVHAVGLIKSRKQNQRKNKEKTKWNHNDNHFILVKKVVTTKNIRFRKVRIQDLPINNNQEAESEAQPR